MRRSIFFVVVGTLLAALGPVWADDVMEDDPPRDPFTLNWWSMDAGGGPSAGGDFQLLATIGQADAGVSFGEGYVLVSGFLAGGDFDTIFADGFESGTTDRWDATTGGP